MYWSDTSVMTHQYVLQGLDALSSANNKTGRYEFWLESFEVTLDGRGRMGSLVGASSEVRKTAATDSNLNEYAVRSDGSTASVND